MVVDSHEHTQETLRDPLQVAQRQIAFIELSVEEDVVDDLTDDAFETGGAWILERSRCRLYRVRDHDDAGFLRLRLGPWIAKLRLRYFAKRRIVAFLRPLIEVRDELGAVMLRDDIDELRGEIDLLPHLDAFFHVAGNDERAHLGGESIVSIGSSVLVLDEVVHFTKLADVMVESRRATEDGVCSNRLRRSLG